MNRNSYIVRVARIAQHFPFAIFRPFEFPFLKLLNKTNEKPKLIILLALPRSGSTLTYQTLIHGLGATYLSNIWNLFYAVPLFGGLLSRRICGTHTSDFKSQHGFVSGLCGPAEGLKFWHYWLKNGLSESSSPASDHEISLKRLEYLKSALGCLTTASQPMVGGYLGHVLVANQLLDYFPEAIFVRLHRDPLSNANSIFQIRRHAQANLFSVFPKECTPYMDASLYEQIAAQVYWLNRRLDDQPANDRTIHISYENLCTNPTGELQHITDFANNRGYNLKQRQHLPTNFAQRQISADDGAHLQKISDAMHLMENKHGKMTSRERFGYEL